MEHLISVASFLEVVVHAAGFWEIVVSLMVLVREVNASFDVTCLLFKF
jgi:hypothetical protein